MRMVYWLLLGEPSTDCFWELSTDCYREWFIRCYWELPLGTWYWETSTGTWPATMNLLLTAAGKRPLWEHSTDHWEPSTEKTFSTYYQQTQWLPLDGPLWAWEQITETHSPIFTVPYSFLSAGAAKAALMTSFPAPGCLATLRGLNGQRDAEAYLWPDAVNLEGLFHHTFGLNLKKTKRNTRLDTSVTVLSFRLFFYF